jgi:hypothetical protein
VTYDGEIVLELAIENSTLGGNIEVGGQSAPTFGTRRVTTKLRLREGESNLLAGLIREQDRRDLRGFPGVLRLPIFKQFLSSNDQSIEQTDIVMLLTPHIVRTHELTTADLAPIYIGTQQNLGLGGPPPLIAPAPEEPPAPASTTGPTQIIPTTPGMPPGGVPRAPTASDPGAQQVNRPAPPGTSPVPTAIGPVPEKPVPPAAAPATPPAGTPPAPGATAPAAGIPPVTPPPGTTPPPVDPNAPAPVAPPAAAPPPPGATPPAGAGTPAQVIVTPPGTTFQVAGGPYTVAVSINNVQRISTATLTITFNPNTVRVRNVQDGTFMRQGGVPTSAVPRIDNAAGRVDIVITRTADKVGASGAGLLAALIFDAVGTGASIIQASGVASTPEGAAIPLQFSPVTVTVR